MVNSFKMTEIAVTVLRFDGVLQAVQSGIEGGDAGQENDRQQQNEPPASDMVGDFLANEHPKRRRIGVGLVEAVAVRQGARKFAKPVGQALRHRIPPFI
ncbi:hypothetical protein VQ056_14400 [Paenibacillus sp. JTLBN-2024]